LIFNLLRPEKTKFWIFGWHITGHNSTADRGRELLKSSKDAESPAVLIFKKLEVLGLNVVWRGQNNSADQGFF